MNAFGFLCSAGCPVSALLAQAEAPAGSCKTAGASGLEGLLFPILIIVVIFFLMIMPQRKKEKQRRAMLADLKRGDRVVTIGGVHGEIAQLDDDTAILSVDAQKGTTLKLTRAAISRVVTDDEEAKAD